MFISTSTTDKDYVDRILDEFRARLTADLVLSNEDELVLVAFKTSRLNSELNASAIERLWSIFPHLRTELEDAKLRKVLEALMPDVEVPKHRLIEASMEADAKRSVLESGYWITAADIAAKAGFSKRNPKAQPNSWKAARKIFAISYKGSDLYPVYGLEFTPASVRPRPAVKEVIETLEMETWHLAMWFDSPCSYLGGRKPQEVISENPAAVIEAARDARRGVLHG